MCIWWMNAGLYLHKRLFHSWKDLFKIMCKNLVWNYSLKLRSWAEFFRPISVQIFKSCKIQYCYWARKSSAKYCVLVFKSLFFLLFFFCVEHLSAAQKDNFAKVAQFANAFFLQSVSYYTLLLHHTKLQPPYFRESWLYHNVYLESVKVRKKFL